ncbi:MAG TPA: thiamine phosphate synthase [Bryobacteraceae bacterium]|nr:thiamine phosphate synthase [Bryobacteraceae bacterium]
MDPLRIPPFYPILDTAVLAEARLDAVDAARAILDGGASILQFRHKGFFSREVFAVAERIAELCRAAGATFIVNDRVDVAMMLGAGVHVGQDDLAPEDARRLMGAGAVIGFSTHNEAQLQAAASEPVDYLALGPLFDTTTKANPDATVGLEELRRLRPLTAKPLVAIGGITRQNATAALEAGADSVAVIGDLIAACRSAADIGKRTEEWLQLTSSPARV